MSVKGEARSPSAKTAENNKRPLNSAQRRVANEVVKTWQDQTPPSWDKPALKQIEADPFGCTCGPCKRFWKENFNNISILEEPVLSRAQKTSTMFRPEQADWRIKVGDRVLVDGKVNGVVKFVGLLDENVIAPSVYVGVKCDEQVGSTHNGVLNGKRYFSCQRGHGALVPYTDVRPLNPPERTPPVTGNFMFESYQEVIKARALRRQKMEAMEETTTHARPVRESRISKKPVYHDENDVAYKDYLRDKMIEDSKREGETQVYHYANTTVKLRGGPAKPKVDPQTRRFTRWKEEFGGGERGEKLVKTLKKLHEALNKGKDIKDGKEEEDEEIAELEQKEDTSKTITDRQSTIPPGSKPPTRHAESRTTS